MSILWHYSSSSSTLQLSSSASIRKVCLSSAARASTLHPLLTYHCLVTPEFFHPNPLCAQRVGRQASTVCIWDACLSMRTIMFLGSVVMIAQCSWTSCSYWCWSWSDHLPLLTRGRSRDYMMNSLLSASIVVYDFEQHTMRTHVNGTTGALIMGPTIG